MLYATKGKVNDAIKRFGWDMARITILEPGYETPFVQSAEITKGLVISTGHDDYSPGKTLRLIQGEVAVDDERQVITVEKDGEIVARITEATDEQFANASYMGQFQEDDIAFMKKHVELFKRQVEDAEKYA
jgi:hypothetical protein